MRGMRAMARPTITYRELVNGLQPQGALPALTGLGRR